MNRTLANICILKSYLKDIHHLDCKWVEDFDAFYILDNKDEAGNDRSIYLTWGNVVIAYDKYVQNLLNIE
jgi:hypothetical protein